MEEKKFNNAIEKSEKLATDAKGDKSVEENKGVENSKSAKVVKTASGANSAKINKGANKKGAKTVNRQTKKVSATENQNSKENAKQTALAKKQENEEKKAKIRIERAKAKELKKQNAKKAKLAKKQAKERKRESLKALKLQKREERKARRDALKHESKADRQERKQKIREMQMQKRREKQERKASFRREKLQARHEKRAQRAQERREKRKTRTSRGLGGWLTAVIVLGVTTLALTTMLIWSNYMSGSGDKLLGGVYAKSFYDLVGYVDNIDVNLSKISVSEDAESKQKYLTDLTVQANLAGEDLESLPLQDESRFSTVKFINQLADFSKYLNNKLIDGEKLSEDDINNLQEFKRINGILKTELNELAKEMGQDFDFITLLNGEQENIVFERFNKLEANAVDYPKMIYDGPFADDEYDLTNKKRSGETVSEEQAMDYLITVFSDYSIENLNFVGTGEGERFTVYNYEGVIGDETFFAQVSEFGEIVMFDSYAVCESNEISRDEAIDSAYKFLEKCGYKSVKAVWTTQSDNLCYVNFAHYQNDVVVYADMIKLTVCLQSGNVYSMDAKSYLENHKEREIYDPKIRVEQAEGKLSDKMQVLTSRLALIPLETGSEKLAYEFFCETANGEEYYVYIDAISGKQLELFKVVLTDEGTLLL